MSIDNGRILEEVTRTSISLLLKEPFYSHLFSCMNKEIVDSDDDVQTMGVGITGNAHTLYINPIFWDNFLTDEKHRYGVIKHEVLHIIFKHTLVNVKNFNKHLLNIAMDIVVNQFIERNQLPDESIFLETFPELQLEKDRTHHYYYDKLIELKNELNGKFKDSEAAKNYNNIQETSHGLNRHDKWVEIYSQNNIDKSLTEAQIENLINIANKKTSVKVFGNLPAGLRSWLEQILIKPKPLVDWRRVVKLFSESSCKTKIRTTLKRPSKRFGTVPGIKIKKLKKLLIAIDTSGSIHKSELADFFNEVYHIWRQGAEIEVVECDVVINRSYAYKGVTPTFVTGGGGTDFNAPIEYGNKTFKPDGLIYFTDGVAPKPKTHSRFPILWVISKEGIETDSNDFKKLPGRKAKL
ncbi:DUF2201 family putative metallopeptidase [Maribacter sp. Asnod1-A12]|uniref:vWA domain-containing protein n=1 Tax=Maribacter sp. Asnod1-A12 TaxID=3160576 RepID=UPI00386F8B85